MRFVFKIGDKVRINDEHIQSYEDDPDKMNYTDGHEELFARGRVFTITDISNGEHIYIDGGIGGWWSYDMLSPAVFLDEGLFKI